MVRPAQSRGAAQQLYATETKKLAGTRCDLPILQPKRVVFPPISIRLPLYTTVLEIPPISFNCSMIIGLMSVLVTNSYAAVKPAGPAPTINAVLLNAKRFLFIKKYYFSGKEIPEVNNQ